MVHTQDRKNSRSAASGQATVHLTTSQSVRSDFTTQSSCSVAVHDVAYTNDGDSDLIEVHIDGILIGSFNTIAASNFGANWNVIRNTGIIGENRKINSGIHQLLLKAVNTDLYGVEIDKSILNLTCTARVPPSPTCTNISLLTDALNCNNSPYANT